jgi:quinate dehydrogenase (quinone)
LSTSFRGNTTVRWPALPIVLFVASITGAEGPPRASEWPSHGHDPGGQRFSPLAQITRDNVARLERAWTYHTGEIDPTVAIGRNGFAFQCTPLVVDGVLYLITPSYRVVALDAETGRERWRFDPRLALEPGGDYPRSRGVAYWEGDAPRGRARQRILFGTGDGRLIALDARTGRPCPDFGRSGEVDLKAGLTDRWPDALYMVTAPPAVYGNLAMVGARIGEWPGQGVSGDVRAFDVRTGALAWRFHTVPRPGEFGNDTWEGESWKDRSGVNAWATISVDKERGLAFLPLGAPAHDFYGGDRKGENLFANSVVAVEAATGRRVWHYQTIHHDLWDRDIPAQPVLLTVRRAGRRVPAVAVMNKAGSIFILDRATGRPLLPVEERPVPPSRVPGEQAWPTQPVPLLPPPLVRHAITRDELTEVTPESRRFCTELFDTLHNAGPWEPFGVEPTLRFPGLLGGATWSGGSFDPRSGLLYVNLNELGAVGWVAPPGAPRAPWPRRFWDHREWPCQKPPWGTLNAIDAGSGEVRWRVPLGFVEELAARGIDDTGAPSLGGSIVTAGGLVFIGGSNDRRFRAFDAATGKLLWTAALEGSGHATPITYRGRRSGRQFVVIAAGGGGYLSRHSADALVAFALPRGRRPDKTPRPPAGPAATSGT